jgi:uncharacterized protein (TIGR00730 family)
MLRSLCIFCGSSSGRRPEYAAAVRQVGTELARRRIRIVYGGGRVGLMGMLADAALAAGSEVIGVIPDVLLAKELGHTGLTDLRVVGSMHERKALMAELADGFLALPGGIGTLEEFFEVYTWSQLGLHPKPLGLLDVAGFYRPLLAWLDSAVAEGFLRPEHRAMLAHGPDLATLLAQLASFAPPPTPKWLDESET